MFATNLYTTLTSHTTLIPDHLVSFDQFNSQHESKKIKRHLPEGKLIDFELHMSLNKIVCFSLGYQYSISFSNCSIILGSLMCLMMEQIVFFIDVFLCDCLKMSYTLIRAFIFACFVCVYVWGRWGGGGLKNNGYHQHRLLCMFNESLIKLIKL